MITKNPKINKFSQFAVEHVTVIVTFLFVIGCALIMMYMNYMSGTQVRTTAIEHARLYSHALEEFRSLYTSEVVIRAKSAGIEVTHDYISKPQAIPLPATLSMLLGNRLGGKESGVKSHLYSKYPFPWRQTTGGLNSNFARDAWATLKADPDQPFYRFEEVDGKSSLRYGVSDVMQESCVNCHNSHPDTPKNDWKVGQLRGVLEVVMPIERHTIMATRFMTETLSILIGILAISLLLVGFVLKQLRLSAKISKELALVTTETNRQLEIEAEQRKQVENELRILSVTDSLTGLNNRRKFDEMLDLEWKRSQRNQTEIALIMLDVDHFKLFNDCYGHDRGDDALRQVASELQQVVSRSYDLVARIGGEEFVVLMADTDLAGAMHIAEKCRVGVEKRAIPHKYSKNSDVVTISLGVSVLIPDKNTMSSGLYTSCDKALYQAKEAGRNCVRNRKAANVKLLKNKRA